MRAAVGVGTGSRGGGMMVFQWDERLTCCSYNFLGVSWV